MGMDAYVLWITIALLNDTAHNAWRGLLIGYDISHIPEEFNDKILCPDLNDSEMERLHGELNKIYETYCLDESIDKIRFDPFIVEEIRNSE